MCAEPSSFKPVVSTAGSTSSQLRVEPRLRSEGVMAPPASDAATLRRQVAALQMDLEQRMDGENRLQGINQQLRERLELYMKQNHENVERAESELNTLHEDMEQTLELQRRLAQRTSHLEKEKIELEEVLQKHTQDFQSERSSLQSRIDNLLEDLRSQKDAQMRAKGLQDELESSSAMKLKLEEQLHTSVDEIDLFKRKAEQFRNELAQVIDKAQKTQLLEHKGRRAQLRRCFYWFQERVRENSVYNSHEVAALSFAKLNSSKRGLRALRLATLRASQMRAALNRQAKACLLECWKAWRLSTLSKKKAEGALEHRKRYWKCKTIFNWKKAVEDSKLTEAEEKPLSDIAARHLSQTLCRRALTYWFQWLVCCARPRQLKLKILQFRLDKLIREQAIAAWQSLVRARRCKALKLEQADLKRVLWVQRRALSRWKRFAVISNLKKNLVSKGLEFWRIHQRQAVLHGWKKYLHLKKNQNLSKHVAFRHYLQILKSKGIATWRKNIKYQQAEVKAIQQVNQALIKAAMSLWQDYHASHAIKRKKEMKASINCKRRGRKLAKAVILLWWEESSSKRLISHLGDILASQRKHATLRISLNIWLHAAFGHVLFVNVKLQHDLVDAKAQIEEHRDQTTAIDVENLQLIDRLHALSSEIALLKITISEKEKQEEDLHRALEDGALIESSMQGELEQHRSRAQELQLEVLKLQRKLQRKNIEDTEGEVHHTMATQKLYRNVKDLQRQLADKSLQLESYEKALKETAERLEGASDESHEKLTSAFDMAASLRKLLEDRESQCATLEGTCRRKELELGEIQKKLAITQSKFSETVEAREARIHELENMLAQKQAELQESQLELQEMRLASNNRDSHVRKLEYEMKLKSDRESHMARTFISGLTSLSAAPRADDVAYLQQRKTDLSNAKSKDAPLAFVTKPGSNSNSSVPANGCGVVKSGLSDEGMMLDECCSSSATNSTSSSNTSSSTCEDDVDDERVMTTSPRARSDWETSFALVSTTRPISSQLAPEHHHRHHRRRHHQQQQSYNAENHRSNNTMAVDEDPGLHAEIQRLQARIMTRLRDNHQG